MPKLLDIASVKIGKTVSANPRRTLYDLSNRLNKTELNNKNALRTSLTTGSEEKLGNIRIPESRDEDIFAGWMPTDSCRKKSCGIWAIALNSSTWRNIWAAKSGNGCGWQRN